MIIPETEKVSQYIERSGILNSAPGRYEDGVVIGYVSSSGEIETSIFRNMRDS